MDDSKYGSRKLIVTSVTILITVILPMLYKHLGISDEVTLLVEGAIAASAGVYNAANALQKKYEAPSDAPKS